MKKHLIRIKVIILIIVGFVLIYLFVMIKPLKYFISFKPKESNITVIDEHFYENEYYSLLDEDELLPVVYYNDLDIEDIKNLNVETAIYGKVHTEYEYVIYKKYIEDFYKEVINYEDNVYQPIKLESSDEGGFTFKYGLYDFDNNGIKELLIISDNKLFKLLTIQENKCIELFRDSIYRNTLNLYSERQVRFNVKNEPRVLYYESHAHFRNCYIYIIKSNMLIKEYEYSLPGTNTNSGNYIKINLIKNLYEPYHIIDNIIIDTLSFFDKDFMWHSDFWHQWWYDRQQVALNEIYHGYKPFKTDFYVIKISKENIKRSNE